MSMKTLKTLLWSLLCLTFVVSCGEDPTTEPTPTPPSGPEITKDSVIKLGKNTVNASLSGGKYTLDYTIQNPHAGTKVTASAAEPWVLDFDLTTPNLIQFNVEPNTGDEPRSCLVTVEYRFADPVVFTVKQGARVDKGFSIENVTSTYFDYTVDVIPEDKTTPYIVMSAHPEYIIASGFKTPEDFYEDDLAYFAWLGQWKGQSALDVMQIRAKVGDQVGVNVTGAAPGTPYTFYCYYIDSTNGALISDVHLFTVKTASPVLSNVEFDFKHEIIDGCLVSADVTPVGYTGDYYYDMLPKVLVESYLYELVDLEGKQYFTTVEEVLEYWWSDAVVEMMADMSSDQILAEFTCVGWNDKEQTDPRSHYNFELLANQEYYLFAYTMEENALCSSVPQFELIKTGDVSMSTNEITVEVNKVTARTAEFTFTPTNDDYYVAGWEKASDWATYGKNDAERMQYLLRNMDYALLKGPQATNVLNLESDTEYVLYAFGSRGGVATTSSIFSTTFKTKPGGAGSVTISFKDLGYYDSSDFANIDGYEYLSNYAGFAILPLEVEFNSEDHGDWFMEVYDWTGRSDVYDDKQYTDGLVWAINEYGSMTASHTYTFVEFGRQYEIVGIVLDADGMFSSLYKRWISPTYDGAGDAANYVSWWNAYQESQNTGGDIELQSLVIDNKNNTLFSKKVRASKASVKSFEAKNEVEPSVEDITIRK